MCPNSKIFILLIFMEFNIRTLVDFGWTRVTSVYLNMCSTLLRIARAGQDKRNSLETTKSGFLFKIAINRAS